MGILKNLLVAVGVVAGAASSINCSGPQERYLLEGKDAPWIAQKVGGMANIVDANIPPVVEDARKEAADSLKKIPEGIGRAGRGLIGLIPGANPKEVKGGLTAGKIAGWVPYHAVEAVGGLVDALDGAVGTVADGINYLGLSRFKQATRRNSTNRMFGVLSEEARKKSDTPAGKSQDRLNGVLEVAPGAAIEAGRGALYFLKNAVKLPVPASLDYRWNRAMKSAGFPINEEHLKRLEGRFTKCKVVSGELGGYPYNAIDPDTQKQNAAREALGYLPGVVDLIVNGTVVVKDDRGGLCYIMQDGKPERGIGVPAKVVDHIEKGITLRPGARLNEYGGNYPNTQGNQRNSPGYNYVTKNGTEFRPRRMWELEIPAIISSFGPGGGSGGCGTTGGRSGGGGGAKINYDDNKKITLARGYGGREAAKFARARGMKCLR